MEVHGLTNTEVVLNGAENSLWSCRPAIEHTITSMLTGITGVSGLTGISRLTRNAGLPADGEAEIHSDLLAILTITKLTNDEISGDRTTGDRQRLIRWRITLVIVNPVGIRAIGVGVNLLALARVTRVTAPVVRNGRTRGAFPAVILVTGQEDSGSQCDHQDSKGIA